MGGSELCGYAQWFSSPLHEVGTQETPRPGQDRYGGYQRDSGTFNCISIVLLNLKKY